MSDDQFADNDTDNDPERTLITLDQLSQTIEVMTSVVNRLRQHLSDQLKLKIAEQSALEQARDTLPDHIESAATSDDNQIKVSEKMSDSAAQQAAQKRESFVIEISQQEIEPSRKGNKVLH